VERLLIKHNISQSKGVNGHKQPFLWLAGEFKGEVIVKDARVFGGRPGIEECKNERPGDDVKITGKGDRCGIMIVSKDLKACGNVNAEFRNICGCSENENGQAFYQTGRVDRITFTPPYEQCYYGKKYPNKVYGYNGDEGVKNLGKRGDGKCSK